jgi:hypothetical protein
MESLGVFLNPFFKPKTLFLKIFPKKLNPFPGQKNFFFLEIKIFFSLFQKKNPFFPLYRALTKKFYKPTSKNSGEIFFFSTNPPLFKKEFFSSKKEKKKRGSPPKKKRPL